MGAMQRNKGKAGEREIANLLAELTGFDVRRKVRQLDGESDLEGIPGWCLEVKRHAKAPRGSIRRWWAQAERQAKAAGQLPALVYRQDRDEWRCVWPVAATLAMQAAHQWHGYEWTTEGSPAAFAAVVRESKT